MQKSYLICVAGHRGLAGPTLVRAPGTAGYRNLLLRTRFQLDLRDRSAVRHFFHSARPGQVFFGAARESEIAVWPIPPASPATAPHPSFFSR